MHKKAYKEGLTMKKWYRKTVTRTIVLVVAILSGALLVTNLLSLLTLAGGMSLSQIQKMNTQSFEESEEFSKMVESYMYDVQEKLYLQNLFESDGAYNPKKLVDVMELSKKGKISETNLSGVTYTMEELVNNRVYVKVIDYKTGNTSFDLLALYHGLQLQLMVYLDGALQVEKRKYPDREIVPAGVFYYNVKDPMIQEKIHADMESINEQMLKKMKMNGLVQADDNMSTKIDSTMASIPVSLNRDGSFSKRSSVASRKQFDALGAYVRRKICDIRESILDGNAAVEPYELGKKNACTYCPYLTVCGFDRKIPGYEFHRLSSIEEDALWKKIMKGEEENGSEMD